MTPFFTSSPDSPHTLIQNLFAEDDAAAPHTLYRIWSQIVPYEGDEACLNDLSCQVASGLIGRLPEASERPRLQEHLADFLSELVQLKALARVAPRAQALLVQALARSAEVLAAWMQQPSTRIQACVLLSHAGPTGASMLRQGFSRTPDAKERVALAPLLSASIQDEEERVQALVRCLAGERELSVKLVLVGLLGPDADQHPESLDALHAIFRNVGSLDRGDVVSLRETLPLGLLERCADQLIDDLPGLPPMEQAACLNAIEWLFPLVSRYPSRMQVRALHAIADLARRHPDAVVGIEGVDVLLCHPWVLQPEVDEVASPWHGVDLDVEAALGRSAGSAEVLALLAALEPSGEPASGHRPLAAQLWEQLRKAAVDDDDDEADFDFDDDDDDDDDDEIDGFAFPVPGQGITLIFNDELFNLRSGAQILSHVQFSAKGLVSDDMAAFTGALPGGMALGMTRAKVHAKLGPPTEKEGRRDSWSRKDRQVDVAYLKGKACLVTCSLIHRDRRRFWYD